MEKKLTNKEIRDMMTDRTHRCKLFCCDILRTGVCCFYCVGNCREKCNNNPKICGQLVSAEKEEK